MKTQKFLKILVIGLGVAIVLALGLVVYGVARLGKNMDAPQAVAAGSARPTTTAALSPGETDLAQPVGTEFKQMLTVNDGHVAVLMTGGALPDRLGIIDLKTGKLISTIYTSAPAAAANP
ncbi:MAG: hypothetical protein JNM81_10955 [Rhodospirillaceae bacterium]|nr:hypothetical protein [Rhodospirillaceae bacterium]